MRKTLFLLLGVLMALPAIARDFTYTYEGQTLTYSVVNGKNVTDCYVKTGYDVYSKTGNGVSGDLIIPAVAKDGDAEYTVIGIDSDAFNGCSSLTSVVIPNSVTEIGGYAFCLCKGLVDVTVGDSVELIGERAFMGCEALANLTLGRSVKSIGEAAFCVTAITSLILGNSVESIGDYAFSRCRNLSSAIIGNSVTTIGEGVFYDCSGLTSVEIPNSVQIISPIAFCECSSLTSITLPQSLELMGSSVFSGCEAIKEVVYMGQTPVEADETVFENVVYENAILHVESGCKDAFEKVTPWNKFANIAEMSTPVSELLFKQSVYDLAPGETLDLNEEVVIAPEDATNRELAWKSSDEAVATVSDGIVVVRAEGECEITATSTDGTDRSAVCTINAQASLGSIESADDEAFDVFSIDGVLLMRNSDRSALSRLDKGVYIIRSAGEVKKIAIK